MNDLYLKMIMKRHGKTALSFLILIILLGCTGQKGGEGGVTTSRDFYKGTNGLNINFLENSPPKEVYENSDFIVGLNLRNEGAYDIEYGVLTFGVEKDYVTLKGDGKIDLAEKIKPIKNEKNENEKNALEFKLDGKNIFTPTGEQGTVYLTPAANALATQSQSLKSSISATACYLYKTEAVATVCIDTDITNTRIKEKACMVKDISFDSQGAPIAVSRVEYQMLPKGANFVRPEFIIYLENKGNGQVLKHDRSFIRNACGIGKFSEDEEKSVFNVVRLRASLSGGIEKPLRCEPALDSYTAIVKLKEKKGIARCILDEGVGIFEGTFTTPLKIEIDYGYTFTVTQDITIKKQEG